MAETRRRPWRAAALGFLLVGAVGSVTGGIAWDRYQHDRARQAFIGTASTVAASVGATIRRDLDFESSFRALVATFPGLTNHQLAQWLRNLDIRQRYPGTMGFGFIVPVTAAELPAFETTMQQDPLVGERPGLHTFHLSGARPPYCLARLGFGTTSTPVMAGFDECAVPNRRGNATRVLRTIKATRDDGRPVVLTHAEITGFRDVSYPAGEFAILAPVYQGGPTPGTVAGRQAAFRGVIVASFNAHQLVRPALGATGFAGTVRAGATGSRGVVGSAGAITSGDHFRLVRTVSTDPPFQVTVVGPAGSAALAQGLVLGAIGALLSAALALFVVHLGRSRRAEASTGRFRHQALHDPVTGLPNRTLLFDRAAQMLGRARRRPLAVGALYLDLDNFKDVNDTFGHHVGDQLLCAVGQRLRSALRPSDTVGRLGGDEFLALVEGDTFDAGPELVAERLQAVLAEPFVVEVPERTELVVAASIGVAVGVRDRASDLVHDADVALYQAKAAGKGRYVVFRPEMQTAIQDRLALEMDLHQALDADDQLGVVFQPVFDLETLAPRGVEALVRWRHPAKGLLSPAAFVPVAEDCGLIVPLGRLVLHQACTEAAAWQRDGHPLAVAVNVSAVQLERPSFADEVRRVLQRTGLDPERLVLEVAETALMRDVERSAQALVRLKELGVRLAVDDFGTGYSSLAHLRRFPIDAVKIDRSLVAKVNETAESGALVQTLLRLGQELGIETCAEGIEEQAQLDRLRHLGCHCGQGFLLSHPLAAAELATFVRQHRADERSGGRRGRGHRAAPLR